MGTPHPRRLKWPRQNFRRVPIDAPKFSRFFVSSFKCLCIEFCIAKYYNNSAKPYGVKNGHIDVLFALNFMVSLP